MQTTSIYAPCQLHILILPLASAQSLWILPCRHCRSFLKSAGLAAHQLLIDTACSKARQFVTQDPLRSQDLRRLDHASFQRSPVPGSIVASMLSPAVDHASRPAPGEAPHPDGTWLPASPTLMDQHGIIDVFVDSTGIVENSHEFIVHSFGCGPCRYWISPLRTPADATRIITARLRRTEATVLWPQDAPCLPGLPIHAVVLPTATLSTLHWSMLAVSSPLVEPAFGPFISHPPCGWTRLSRMRWPVAKFASRLPVQWLTASVATAISAQTPESLLLPSMPRVARAATAFSATQRRFLIYRASSRRSCAFQPLLRRQPR